MEHYTAHLSALRGELQKKEKNDKQKTISILHSKSSSQKQVFKPNGDSQKTVRVKIKFII